MIDLGFHPSTVYFPLVVEEAMMVEPTETESKATLESFAEALRQAARDARERPEILREAPSRHRSGGSMRQGPHGLSSSLVALATSPWVPVSSHL